MNTIYWLVWNKSPNFGLLATELARSRRGSTSPVARRRPRPSMPVKIAIGSALIAMTLPCFAGTAAQGGVINPTNTGGASPATADAFSIAIGGGSGSTAQNISVAIGDASSATGANSIGIGRQISVTGANATAVGWQANTSGANAAAFGVLAHGTGAGSNYFGDRSIGGVRAFCKIDDTTGGRNAGRRQFPAR